MQALLIAAAVALGMPPVTASSQKIDGVYRSLSEIASRTCLAPAQEGWTVQGKLGAKASLDWKVFKKLLGDAGVSVSGELSGSRWAGPLQKDVGLALATRNDCAKDVFVAVVNHLPLRDSKTGAAITKPSRPTMLYKMISEITYQTINNSSGNSVGSGQQIVAAPSSTNTQVAGPSATSGSAIQNNFFPPVTSDQKQQAREALLADLSELARYPERGDLKPGPAVVQQFFKFKAPRSLYLLLSKYDYDTISSVSGGSDLNDFEKLYYQFETTVPQTDQIMLSYIGKNVPQTMSFMWVPLYQYCILRSANLPPEKVHDLMGGDQNYGITSDEEESLYAKIRKDPVLGPALKAEAGSIDAFTVAANNALKPFLPH